MDRQFYEEEEQEITITARRYTGTSYYWDGGNGGDTSWGGDGGGGGGGVYAAPVAQHTQDCGTENGAAVQVAKHVKGELPPGVSGPVDPVKTSSGNDWRKVEFGAMIVANANGFGALNDTIYSSNLSGDIRISYDAAQPVVGFWHSHPAADRSTELQLIGRYPSSDDWAMLERIKAGAGAVSNPSLWIMDAFGTTREFKYEDREYFKNLLNEASKMKMGEGLEGRERAESCG